jgi:hypothetical protein
MEGKDLMSVIGTWFHEQRNSPIWGHWLEQNWLVLVIDLIDSRSQLHNDCWAIWYFKMLSVQSDDNAIIAISRKWHVVDWRFLIFERFLAFYVCSLCYCFGCGLFRILWSLSLRTFCCLCALCYCFGCGLFGSLLIWRIGCCLESWRLSVDS